jgi:hypothetical protein
MNPFAIRVFSNGQHQKLMINIIKEALNIYVKHPIILPAAFPGYTHSLNR